MEAQYFEKLVSEFLTNFKQVYSLFGWWGLGIVALNFPADVAYKSRNQEIVWFD